VGAKMDDFFPPLLGALDRLATLQSRNELRTSVRLLEHRPDVN